MSAPFAFLFNIVLFCSVCCILFVQQGMFKGVNATNSVSTFCSTNTSAQAHVMELDREIEELVCIKKRLTDVIAILSTNATQNSGIISIRSKHLEKINHALSFLIEESTFLKKGSLASTTISNLNGNGFTFGDGSRERSCKGYRYPSLPYQYENQGSGLYIIEPTPGLIMTVYCDMTTDGGGWTLVSGNKGEYEGIHFHTFEDSTAVSTSNITSFHIKTAALLNNATQVRAATDSSSLPFTSFHQSSWAFSAACTISNELRNAITLTPTVNNGDLPATCMVLNGLSKSPTHFTYGRSCNSHSTGFRLGFPHPNCAAHMNQESYATFSFHGAAEGIFQVELGVYYSFSGENRRSGAIFLR